MIGIFQFSLSHTLGSSVEVMTSFTEILILQNQQDKLLQNLTMVILTYIECPQPFLCRSIQQLYNYFFYTNNHKYYSCKLVKRKIFKIVFLLAILAALTSGTREIFFT